MDKNVFDYQPLILLILHAEYRLEEEKDILHSKGYSVKQITIDGANKEQPWLDQIRQNSFDAIVMSTQLPDDSLQDTIDLMNKLYDEESNLILISKVAPKHEQLINAFRQGIFDFIEYPTIKDEIISSIEKAVEINKSRKVERATQEHSQNINNLLYMLLRSSLSDKPLEQLLSQSLSYILTSALIAPLKRGEIFFFDETTKLLKLVARQNLGQDSCIIDNVVIPEEVIKNHQKLALKKRGRFISYDIGMQLCENCEDDHHSHYHISLVSSQSKPIGLLNICLSPDYVYSKAEHRLLQAVADTLVGMMEKSKSDKDRLDMQDQLIQSAKLASIGTLASGVAHELNNPLAVITGMCSLIKKDIIRGNDIVKIKEKTHKVSLAADRMTIIISHLQTFARKGKAEDLEEFSLEQPIKKILSFLNSRLNTQSIEVKIDISEELKEGGVWGNLNQLESVFQNLLLNSMDALELVTDGRNKQISISAVIENEQIEIIYSDNALGIAADIISAVFDPFFTTKDQGKGTGLGLSLVKNIMDNHRGSIEVIKSDFTGTDFRILLPYHLTRGDHKESMEEEVEDKVFKGLSALKIKARLLVIDDEEDILELVGDFLEDYFNCILVNPEDALSAIKNKQYDMVLTDIRMPGIDGDLVIETVRKYHPKAKIFVMSGFSPDSPEAIPAVSKNVDGFIQKPFPEEKDILKVIDKALLV